MEASDVLFRGVIPLVSIMLGGLLTYFTNRLLDRRRTRRERSIQVFEEFHSSEMLELRNLAVETLDSNPDLTIEELFDGLPRNEYMPLSAVFHFFEKVAVYDRAGYLDAMLLRELLGRYFTYYHDVYYSQLTGGLEEDSEFQDMMNGLQHVAKTMGKAAGAN